MRISSTTFYSSMLPGLMTQQSAIAKLSQQIATGQRLTSAVDDPVAATQIMSLNDRIALSTQYKANLDSVDQVQQEETTVLNQLQSNLDTARQTLTGVTGSDQTLNVSAAATLAGLYQQIKDLANYQDSNGNYIFAGFQTSTQPYDHTAVYDTGATTSPASTYAGDSGVRYVQIGQGVTVQANDNLDSVMQSGTSADLLQTIDQIATSLQQNTATQADVAAAYTVIGDALHNLQSIQAALASRQRQVSSQQDTIQQLLTTNQNALSNLSQVDQAKAIVELQQRQTSLQAAESAFAQTSGLSLFNYL